MKDKVCAFCGRRFSQYLETGYLGCPECYESFNPELINDIKRIQGSTCHNGKRPVITEEDRTLLLEYRGLLAEKQKAFLNGNYSVTRELTAEIEDLAEELKSRGLI